MLSGGILDLKLNIPSPVHFVDTFQEEVALHIKREDLIHNAFGGNKWRKLKYNIDYFLKNNLSTLITFGGPFSNHIAAVSSIGNYYKIPTVGIIRGTYEDPNNPTVLKAKSNGMQIWHIPKLEYKLKEESPQVQSIISQYAGPYVVPEGGSNAWAKKGVIECGKEIISQGHFSDVIVGAGTGMTASGIIDALDNQSKVWVVNVLKNTGLKRTIEAQVSCENKNWEIVDNYTFGGYAKTTEELIIFAQSFYKKYKIKLDPIYTAKTLFASLDLIKQKKIQPHSNVLAIHTGGLQGIEGFEYVSKNVWL